MNSDLDRIRALALLDAHDHARRCRAALVAAAEGEPKSQRLAALMTLHAQVADIQSELEGLKQ